MQAFMNEEPNKLEDFLKRLFAKKNTDPAKTQKTIDKLVKIHTEIQEKEREKKINQQSCSKRA